jgi:2-iminobutanoate/2-iminopropanoate deaminase
MAAKIETRGAPGAIGPYSQAIAAGELIFCSGQIGLDPANTAMVEGGVEAQTRRAMDNIRAVLERAGADFSHVVKATIFLADLKDFEAVNRIYGTYFSPPYPARSTIQAAALPRGALVEIEVIAVKPR